MLSRFATLGGLPGDPYWANVSYLLVGNGANGTTTNIKDSSSNNFTTTVNGNTVISTAQSKFGTGSSVLYDGNGDYTSSPSNSAFSFGVGAYTVELWAYPLAVSNQVYAAMDTTGGSVFYYEVGTGFVIAPRGGGAVVSGGNGTLTATSWQHIAFCRASTGSNQTKIYVNGQSVVTGTDSTNWVITGPFVTGGLAANIYMFNGYIYDLRITKGVCRYTADFTPPPFPPTSPMPTQGP
jgi:hypothetical protein